MGKFLPLSVVYVGFLYMSLIFDGQAKLDPLRRHVGSSVILQYGNWDTRI
jgi:hypothetical protein